MEKSESSKPKTRQELLEAQRKYCLAKGYPMFAPGNGLCWSCGKDCVHQGWSSTLITGCNQCHKSYCD